MSSGEIMAAPQRQEPQAAWTTPPSSPRPATAAPTTPPPLRRPGAEPLLLGLERNCPRRVRLALSADPEAARSPFWERRFEWPLCAALRLGCSEEIIRLLTEHGAKVDVTDNVGQSPLQLLSSGVEANITDARINDMRGLLGFDGWAEQFELGVATALLIAGADPEACPGDPGRGHHSSLQLARRARKGHLVGLYEARGHQLTA